MLDIKKLSVAYETIPVLHDLDIYVGKGETVALLGSNGAGKTTFLNTVAGMMKPKSGSIYYNGESLAELPPHRIVYKGVVLIPEGYRLFPYMTVKENLYLGAYQPHAWKKKEETLKWVYELFPSLYERSNMQASFLSGGEQQMLCIGRGLMSIPELVMVDEPSIGLAPLLVENIYKSLDQLRKSEGITILIAEQSALRVLSYADRGYVLQEGKVILEDTSENLKNSDIVKQAYLGK
ncbi:MAG: ABC transporter ATP-binding protein [Desulfobacteraceae bacterium]|nr:ABC transporter ATP-binding protein [Desulfobacteraceae bacterium]